VLSSPCPWQSLATEALGEGLRIIRLGKAEHHEVGIVATEVIWPRRDRQAIREPRTASSFTMPRTLSADSATWCGH